MAELSLFLLYFLFYYILLHRPNKTFENDVIKICNLVVRCGATSTLFTLGQTSILQ
jgi:hypothetical protein